MRAADRRTLAQDLVLLAEHLKRVYALSVSAVPPSTSRPQLSPGISVSSSERIITVMLDDPIPLDLPYHPPNYLDYYEIKYVVVKKDNISEIRSGHPYPV